MVTEASIRIVAADSAEASFPAHHNGVTSPSPRKEIATFLSLRFAVLQAGIIHNQFLVVKFHIFHSLR